MYTNALLGSGEEQRHIWYVRQQRALAEAREAGEQHAEGSLCGERMAVVNPPASDRLVPIREYNVDTLAEFLANSSVCAECQATVVEDTGFDWDDYEGDFTANDAWHLEPPDWVADEYHEDGVEQVRDEWYDQPPAAEDQDLQAALNAALGRVRINSYGSPMHLFKRGEGRISFCGTGLDDIPLPENTTPDQQGLFAAGENYEMLGALLDDWLPEGNDAYCTECAHLLAEQTETLRGLTKDALEKYAQQHRERQLDSEASVRLEDLKENAGPPTHTNARCSTAVVDPDLTTAQDAAEAGRRLAQGEVQHEVNIEVEVDGEDARRLRKWLSEQNDG